MDIRKCFGETDNIPSKLVYEKMDNIISPFISIVIPTYKRSDFLEEAVMSAVNQNNVDTSLYEIVIVNNDPASEVPAFLNEVEDKNLRVYRNETNLGMCGNINRCAQLARGQYIAYLHDDDILLPNYLEEILNVLRNTPDAGAIIPARYILYANSSGVYGANGKRRQRIIDNIYDVLSVFYNKERMNQVTVKDCVHSWNNCFNAPSCGTVFNRQAVLDFGGFDSQWTYAFDFLFYLDFSEKYKVYLLHDYLGIYRMIDSASNKAAVQRNFFESFEYMRKRYYNDYPIIQIYSKEMKWQSFQSCCAETQKQIRDSNENLSFNKLKFIWFKIRRFWYYYTNNMNIVRLLPQK